MISNILFICIGNICRSPIAEGLFRHALPAKEVCSAGLDAMVGEPADPMSTRLMQERGIDISSHRARSLATWMVNEADLIVTMDRSQKHFIERLHANAKGKVMRLGEAGNYDVPDPYRQGLAAFRHSYGLIARGVDQLAQRIAESSDGKSQHVPKALRELPSSFRM